MKNLCVLAGLLFLIPNKGTSQNFSFTEGNLVEADIELVVYQSAQSTILNSSMSAVTFEWELTGFDNPADWLYFSTCDYSTCYFDGETSGTMSAVPPGSELAVLKVSINAFAYGVGTYKYVVWDQAIPDAKDTITFVLTASDPSLSIDQNKTTDVITTVDTYSTTIWNHSSESIHYSVLNISGRQMANGVLAGENKTILGNSQFNSGIYFLTFTKQNGLIETKKIIIP